MCPPVSAMHIISQTIAVTSSRSVNLFHLLTISFNLCSPIKPFPLPPIHCQPLFPPKNLVSPPPVVLKMYCWLTGRYQHEKLMASLLNFWRLHKSEWMSCCAACINHLWRIHASPLTGHIQVLFLSLNLETLILLELQVNVATSISCKIIEPATFSRLTCMIIATFMLTDTALVNFIQVKLNSSNPPQISTTTSIRPLNQGIYSHCWSIRYRTAAQPHRKLICE